MNSPPTRTVTVALTTALAVLAVAALAWAAHLDLFVAGVWRHWIVPALIFAPAGLVAAIAFASRKRAMRAIGAGTAALAIFLMFAPWHPRKVFVSQLHSIDKGMSIDEVEAIMGSYPKGTGWPMPPSHSVAPAGIPAYPEGEARAHATGTMTYHRNSTGSSYSRDWGQVKFQDGKVVAVEFVPD